ncbi:MAG: DUF3817 domain-containing protein [Verrucomicrobiota bacterium]
MTPNKLIQSLRLTALIEGLSWLALIGAMISRHFTGVHDPVRIWGSIHGGLFCLFALTLFLNWRQNKWSLPFCSLIPLGFLAADPFLKKKLPPAT